MERVFVKTALDDKVLMKKLIYVYQPVVELISRKESSFNVT